jgi:hypothetical protein
MSNAVHILDEFTKRKQAEIQRVSDDPELRHVVLTHLQWDGCMSDVLRAITPHARALGKELGISASAAGELLFDQLSNATLIIDEVQGIEER